MAKKINVTLNIDASQMIKYYNFGLEAMFMLMQDFSELDQELNINNISTPEDDQEV